MTNPPMRHISALTAQREHDILGYPPRIAALGPADVAPDARNAILEVLAAIGRPPPKEMTAFTAIMLRNYELYRHHMRLGLQLYTGALPVRLRELAILRTAWLTQSPYEWGEHVDAGKRLVGLTGEEVERVTIGSSASDWSQADRTVLRAVEEMLSDAMISDVTWAVLENYLNPAQLIELPILVGQYLGVAYLQNSIRIPLLPGNPGLRAR